MNDFRAKKGVGVQTNFLVKVKSLIEDPVRLVLGLP
jgi:hypothetical protein